MSEFSRSGDVVPGPRDSRDIAADLADAEMVDFYGKSGLLKEDRDYVWPYDEVLHVARAAFVYGLSMAARNPDLAQEMNRLHIEELAKLQDQDGERE